MQLRRHPDPAEVRIFSIKRVGESDAICLIRQDAQKARAMVANCATALGNASAARYSTFLIPAPSITFFHFSVSATIIAPNASRVPIKGSPPSSTSCFCMPGSASTALISLFCFSTISFGVLLRAGMPNSALA